MRPFRFLGIAAPGLCSGAELVATARRAESMGYSTLVVPDHLLDQHAPIPVLATVAAVTKRLRVGTFVFNAGLRHPAVLAQDLATLDVLSGGRLEIGIGAGWNRPEHDAIGLPFGSTGERVSRLAEVVTVLKGCFADAPFSFTGTHFTITDHDGRPKPVQRPHPPLFIGGGGRRLLTLAAREAQIVGLAPRLLPGDQRQPKPEPHSFTLAATEEKIAWIREAAGPRFADLELNTYPSGAPARITGDPLPEARRIADSMYRRTGVRLSEQDVLDSPHVLVGSLDFLTDKVISLRERFGISSIMTGDVDELAPLVERLAGR